MKHTPTITIFESEHARSCLIEHVVPDDTTLTNPRQALDVFTKIDASLRQIDMTFANVIRTWFYIDTILAWYQDFNAVRNAFYSEHGIIKGTIPASTAVGSPNAFGAALTASALAIQPKHNAISIHEIPSPLQCPATNYNTSFSRAVEIAAPDARHLYISGTASIDPHGNTAHAGDIQKQISLTIDVVENILSSRSMGWADITKAVAYVKDINNTKLLLRYLHDNGLRTIPLSITQADICREDLLFEIDAEAIRKSAT